MISHWHYAYADLRVTSELELPEWAVFEQIQPLDDPDVIISLNRSEELAQSVDNFHAISPDEYHFGVADTAEYWVRGGREIRLRPAPHARARDCRLFLLGAAWGALCYQRGLLFLHASVVRVGEDAIAVCGPTGSGKSTLAAWLIERGYPFVSDDLCRFDVTAGQARVYPSAPRLKLWRDALSVLHWSEAGLERDHFRLDKFHVSLPALKRGTAGVGSVPVRVIYLLRWGELRLTRLSGITALRHLVESATYRGDLLENMEMIAPHWERCAALAQRVPVWELTRPRDWGAMEPALNMLNRHFLLRQPRAAQAFCPRGVSPERIERIL